MIKAVIGLLVLLLTAIYGGLLIAAVAVCLF